MQRNGIVFPIGAVAAAVLCFAAALGLASPAVPGAESAPAHLSVLQIGLLGVGTALLLYGISGVVSVWLHGTELRPGRSRPRPPAAALVAGLLLGLGVAALAGWFVSLVRASAAAAKVDPATVGGVVGGAFLAIAVLIALYARFFMLDEVGVEKDHLPEQ